MTGNFPSIFGIRSIPSFATRAHGAELVGRDVEQVFHKPGYSTGLGCQVIIVIARKHIRRLDFTGILVFFM